MSKKNSDTSLNLEENLEAALAYLLGLVSGVIILIVEKKSDFVRFHAMQSTIVFGGLFVFSVVINIIPILGQLIAFLLMPIGVILWVILLIKAFQGEKYKLPVVGNIAEKQLENMGDK